MNGKKILGLIAIMGLAKMAFIHHRHPMGMGSDRRETWFDHVADLHRELHRRDAQAAAEAGATTPVPADEAVTTETA